MLDHVTFRRQDLEAARFLRSRAGLSRSGLGPTFPSRVTWLYDGADPVVHLISGGADAR